MFKRYRRGSTPAAAESAPVNIASRNNRITRSNRSQFNVLTPFTFIIQYYSVLVCRGHGGLGQHWAWTASSSL